jgi:phage terminase large subunit-like protein
LIASAKAGTLNELIADSAAHSREALLKDWEIWARPDQLPPDSDWRTWLILGGRGAGKTRAGAEWVRGVALARKRFGEPARQIALVGESLNDTREVMIEGVSGLLTLHTRWERPQWEPSRRRLEWRNGAVAYAFSADDPESLRGPADRIVVEVNQGGEMARAVLNETDASVPVSEVRATRGKVLRAEPVAALYEQGRVSHAGAFPQLEDEMADFGADGLSNGRSPDRLDALVWAITSLVLMPREALPRMRSL